MRRYKDLWRGLGHARWFAYAVRYAGAHVDRVLYRRWHGRVSIAGPALFDWLLLTTTGRRSGRPRTTPVVYVRDGARVVITTEDFGMAGRPAAWRLNLDACPEATVQIGAKTHRCRARRAASEEIDRYWPRLLEQWPALASYHARSGRRHVFVLEPAA
jgi:F420H(2)-dependent quinone reductase